MWIFIVINIKMNKKTQLFLMQVLCHLALLWAMFNFTGQDWVFSIIVYFFTGCLGVSVTLHRYYSHKSFEFRSVFLKRFATMCSFWGIIGDPIAWVNNHRQHHRLTDKPGDPHSPSIIGFFKVQWGSMFYSYDYLRYVPNMIRDRFLVTMSKYYYPIHWSVITCFSIYDWKLACVFYLVPAAILWNMGSLINTIGHSFGYRSNDTNDNSVNNPILGYLVWGEGWHNNHHFSPASSTFGRKWWEFDMSYWVIRMIGKNEKS